MADIIQEKTNIKADKTNKDFIIAVGRRKEAVAGVRLFDKKTVWDEKEVDKGEIVVNGKKAEDYFGKASETFYKEPLNITNTIDKFAITVKVRGGGKVGQMEAMVLGIARALSDYNREKFRPILKQHEFLTRDSRARQRRKVGMGGKSRRRKQSPKR